MSIPTPPPPPPGWYPDPSAYGFLRFWDGVNWTQAFQQMYFAAPVRPYNPRPYGGNQATDDERFVSFGQAIALGFKRYGRFSGRSSRSEYWWWALFTGLASALPLVAVLAFGLFRDLAKCGFSDGYSVCSYHPSGTYWAILVPLIVWALALVIPSYAVLVRRLHDYNKSGHFVWFLIANPIFSLLPLFGGTVNLGITIWFIVWCCQQGTAGENQYGLPPNEGLARIELRHGQPDMTDAQSSTL